MLEKCQQCTHATPYLEDSLLNKLQSEQFSVWNSFLIIFCVKQLNIGEQELKIVTLVLECGSVALLSVIISSEGHYVSLQVTLSSRW